MARRKKSNYWWITIMCVILAYGCYVFGNKIDINKSNSIVSVETPLQNNKHYDNLDMAKLPNGIASEIIEYTGFRLSFNKDNHTPNWVAWELLEKEVFGTTPRENNFWQDEKIKGCATHNDYKHSGFDRGHMIPAADQKWSQQAMFDSFVMCNICPQDHSLNSGAWNTLENKCRNWAERDSAIIIIAGPIYEKADTQRIGQTAVRVPSAFYKVIIAPYVENPRGIAFVYPNMSSPGNMQNYVTTIDEVEQITSIDFFYNLPDDIENRIESVSSFKTWNKK